MYEDADGGREFRGMGMLWHESENNTCVVLYLSHHICGIGFDLGGGGGGGEEEYDASNLVCTYHA